MAKLPPVSSRGYCISPEPSSAQLSPAQSCTKVKPHLSWSDSIYQGQGAQIHKQPAQSLLWKGARGGERMEQVLQSLSPEKIALEDAAAV